MSGSHVSYYKINAKVVRGIILFFFFSFLKLRNPIMFLSFYYKVCQPFHLYSHPHSVYNSLYYGLVWGNQI